mgnify:CR=1 FL=1
MSTSIDLDRLLRRLHLPTVRRLYAELADRAEKEGMSYRDYLAVLIGEEVAHRAQTRIERSVRRARFPFLATIEEFDFTFQSSLYFRRINVSYGIKFIYVNQQKSDDMLAEISAWTCASRMYFSII